MIKDFLYRQMVRSKLTRAFRGAELYLTHKSGGKQTYIYPKVVSIRKLPERLECVFILRTGMKPKTVRENEFVFRQVFGEMAEVETDDIKKCTLNVYFKKLPKVVKYNIANLSHGDMSLPIMCGIDSKGEHVVFDLAKESHVLISGETGSGKSSLLRVIITYLIQSFTPNDVQFVLGDMKRTEFGIFRNIEHVRGVYVQKNELLDALSMIKKEMERRGDMLDKAEVNDITELDEKLSRIIVAIDEVALLKHEKAHMRIIEEISAIGRALGVHLILSMQRPDSKLLDGALKNNLRVRISGRQSNAINAKVADAPGAHHIGIDERGRMLIKLDELTEFQSFYLEGKKAKELLKEYKSTGVKATPSSHKENIHVQTIFGTLEVSDNEKEL